MASAYLGAERYEDSQRLLQDYLQLSFGKLGTLQAVELKITLARGLAEQSGLAEAREALVELESVVSDLESSTESTRILALVHYSQARFAALQGDALNAQLLFQDALNGFTTVVSSEHAAIHRTLHALAIANKNLGRYSAADKLFVRAIGALGGCFGQSHLTVGFSKSERSLY